jgi:excisionase family DNA binding protein
VSSGYHTRKGEVIEDEDRLLTVPEAARFLNLSIGGVYHLISQRRVEIIRISSRCVRFSRRALLEWVESLTQPIDRKGP